MSWLPRFVGCKLNQHVAAALPCDFNTQTNSPVFISDVPIYTAPFPQASATQLSPNDHKGTESTAATIQAHSKINAFKTLIPDIQSDIKGTVNVMSLTVIYLSICNINMSCVLTTTRHDYKLALLYEGEKHFLCSSGHIKSMTDRKAGGAALTVLWARFRLSGCRGVGLK